MRRVPGLRLGEESEETLMGTNLQPFDAWAIASITFLTTGHWIAGAVCGVVAFLFAAYNFWWTR